MSKKTTDSNLSAPTQPEPIAPQSQQRLYKNSRQIDHDLFKLLVGNMKKNVSYSDRPIYEMVEHSHFFHSVDSSGTPQMRSNEVGGHFHLIKVTPTDGVPVISCSPPMKHVKTRVQGQLQRVAVPLEDDNHVHETQYLRSEKMNVREINAEFVKFEAMMSSKNPGRLDGVLG